MFDKDKFRRDLSEILEETSQYHNSTHSLAFYLIYAILIAWFVVDLYNVIHR